MKKIASTVGYIVLTIIVYGAIGFMMASYLLSPTISGGRML